MTQQYLRKVQLKVADAKFNSYLLSDLHIQFAVFSATVATLKRAEITVWNVTREKANKLLKEFTSVTLSAGYEGQFGIIFDGQIARVEAGKENAVDSYVRLICQDGDLAKNWSMSTQTLAAGWTDDTLYQQLMSDFSKGGLEAGYKPLFKNVSAPRALPLYGKTADYFSALAARQNCDWFIQNNKLHMLPKGQSLPGPQQVLSSRSGMVGVPRLTIDGIMVRCLLNPNIRTGGRVEIDNRQIALLTQQTPLIKGVEAVIPELQGSPGGVGTYVSRAVSHVGDTRGAEWYTDMIGVSIDSTGPKLGPALLSTMGGI